MIRWLILALVSALLFAQTGQQIPETDDPDHPGVPAYCIARDENGRAKNCGVCSMCDKDAGENPRCKTWCLKGKCFCWRACHVTSLHHSEPHGE